ncbi:MAG TPA: serine/threonine-protein kinase [Gemmatimonadaceae bacterium]|nr:serine/threonine-protein kinase [Gemmatimonadaceae bacterium]
MAPTDLREQLQAALGDRYEIIRELPPGGMSRLFLATERSLDRQVVVKVLPPELTNEVNAARFQREITVAANLQHPHILPVLAAGATGSLLYYITPYVEGESLRHRLTRTGQLPVADAVRILTETADALARAHRAGVVHRDIKPENVLLQDGHALLADFGVARALAHATADGPLTESGHVPGTPAYMAPEQLAGEAHVDGRADVYGLAVIGYEMLAGVSPFAGATPQAIAAAHFKTEPRPLTAIRPDVPRTVSDAIARALKSDPDARFATAADFRDALASPGARAVRRPDRRTLILAALAVVVAAGTITTLVWRTGQPRVPVLDRQVIAVEPFTVLDPPLALWHEGMVDVLAHNLDGAGPLRTMAPTSVIHHIRSSGTDPIALARALRAGLAVTGRIERSGPDSVRVIATLLDVASGRPQDEVSARGSIDHMDLVTDSISVALLRSIARIEPVGVARGSLAGAGANSLPALKALLESEQAFRRGAWVQAQTAAEHAIQLDSTFALAYYWAGAARGWAEKAGDSLAAEFSTRAQALNHGLTPRDSLLIATNAAVEAPETLNSVQLQQLFAAADVSVQRYPDDPQIWNNLGEIRTHLGYGPRVGVTNRRVLLPLERAIAIDSDFAPAYEHATHFALAVDGSAAGVRYARRYLAFDPPSPFGQASRLYVALLTTPRDTAGNRRLADASTPHELAYASKALAAVYDSAESETWLGRQLARRVGPLTRIEDNAAVEIVFDGLLNRGHVRDVWSGVRALQVTPIPGEVSALAMFAEVGIVPTPALDSLLRRADNLRAGYSWFGLRWWATRGDTTDLRAFLAARARAVGHEPGKVPVNPATYDTAVTRAYLALAKHDTADALRRFATLPDTLCRGGCALDAITYGELLAGRNQAAAADSLLDRRYRVQITSATDVLLQLALARVANRAGDARTARDAYERVADAWATADSELQPVVTEARAAVARGRAP